MKLNVLLVDDNVEKIRVVEEQISGWAAGLAIRCSIDVASDLVSAKRLLRTIHYDIAVVDVQVPVRIGQSPEKLGGITLVQEIDDNDLLKKPTYIVGLTEYVEEIESIKTALMDRYFAFIDFSRESNAWRTAFTQALAEMFKAIGGRQLALASGSSDASLAIVCALGTPELRSVLDLPAGWEILDQRNDCIDVYEGVIEARNGNHRVIAAAALEPGMAASAALCARVIAEFHPRYLAMTGIAGGMKAATKLGDVIAADVVWDYTSGKIVQKRRRQDFLPEPRTIDLDATVKGQLRRLAETPGLLSKIRNDFLGPKPDHQLDVVFGPMFTGGAVIANSEFAASLGDMNRKIKGIDMEAYSVVCAAKYAASKAPIPIVLKSVSDFADAEKNDDYHAYASYTSARLLYEWAQRFL